jgi:hypothetical protein
MRTPTTCCSRSLAPRNNRAAHGPGDVAQNIGQAEAETFVAAAATAIVFLAKLLR